MSNAEGCVVGDAVGSRDGVMVVEEEMGSIVGVGYGSSVLSTVGFIVGIHDGSEDGISEGIEVG